MANCFFFIYWVFVQHSIWKNWSLLQIILKLLLYNISERKEKMKKKKKKSFFVIMSTVGKFTIIRGNSNYENLPCCV